MTCYNATRPKIALTWPEKNAADEPAWITRSRSRCSKVSRQSWALTPQSEAQRWLQSRALQIGGDLVEERWPLAAENEGSVPRPFLVTLVFWLTILFTGFSLFAPRLPPLWRRCSCARFPCRSRSS